MYSYFYIKTDCRSNTWDTIGILDYLRAFTMLEERDNGIFVSKNPFLDISLMKAAEWMISVKNQRFFTFYLSSIASAACDMHGGLK